QNEIKRRQRPQKSCKPCRTGKLRCDRALPCRECVRRSREPQCVYSSSMQESLAYKSQSQAMRRRLDSLEQMVKDLGGITTRVDKAAEAATPSTADQSSDTSSQPPTGSQGRLKITDSETAFVGPAHWESLVNEIAEIKTHLDDDPDVVSSTLPGVLTQPTTSSGSRGTPDLFFPGPSAYTHSSCPVTRTGYTAFWENPTAASPVWLAVLFDILALGDQYSRKSPPESSEPHPGETFHEMATHAVILADYARPKFYLLEALILLIRYGQTKSDADQLKLWLQLGLVTRLATRMGMFRDAGGRSDVTPFVAEIRRRIWLAICHLDIIFSYQIGLVSVIRALQANTAMPLNLEDSDFSTQSEHLPPPRPASEKTFIASSIIMGHMILIFAEAVSLSNSSDRPDPAIAHKLNAQLTRIHEDTPSIFRMKSLDQSFGDTQLIMERIKVELFRLKTFASFSDAILARQIILKESYVSEPHLRSSTSISSLVRLSGRADNSNPSITSKYGIVWTASSWGVLSLGLSSLIASTGQSRMDQNRAFRKSENL
ncbi:fungal-specific transcription factor domain-containing protein, partial [Elsinoe ampelina]